MIHNDWDEPQETFATALDTLRNATVTGGAFDGQAQRTHPNLTPPSPESEEGEERFRLYRMCRDETLELVATATDPESVGVALVTLAREGEWANDCSFGLLDRQGEKNHRWLILPFRASTRNVSDAARVLAKSKTPTIPTT